MSRHCRPLEAGQVHTKIVNAGDCTLESRAPAADGVNRLAHRIFLCFGAFEKVALVIDISGWNPLKRTCSLPYSLPFPFSGPGHTEAAAIMLLLTHPSSPSAPPHSLQRFCPVNSWLRALVPKQLILVRPVVCLGRMWCQAAEDSACTAITAESPASSKPCYKQPDWVLYLLNMFPRQGTKDQMRLVTLEGRLAACDPRGLCLSSSSSPHPLLS